MSISNTKVLLLNVNRSGWHSGNMIYDMQVVEKACDTVIYGPGWPNYKNNDIRKIIEQVYGDGKPDIIYSYFTPNERVKDVYIKHYKIPKHLWNFPVNFDSIHGIRKIFALSDFWARTKNEYSADLGNAGFTHCISCFAPPYSNPSDFYSFFDESIVKKMKFIGLPRCIDTTCFRPYPVKKKYDVLTAGAMGDFYPFRRDMHKVLSAFNGRRMPTSLSAVSCLKYYNLPHCGVNFKHNGMIREKYAEVISSALIMASCGGKYHLAFNKIFESMACGTVYAGERPYGEEQLGMVSGFNYIRLTPVNFLDQLTFYLDRPNLLDIIVDNGIQTAMKRYSIDVRAEDFVKIINNM